MRGLISITGIGGAGNDAVSESLLILSAVKVLCDQVMTNINVLNQNKLITPASEYRRKKTASQTRLFARGESEALTLLLDD